MVASCKSDQCDIARKLGSEFRRVWGTEQQLTMIGRAPVFRRALQRMERLAAADSPTLVVGETGTGKELFARSLFLRAKSHRKRFLTVNCAQYQNDQILASELFGHRRGSFTGATGDHTGVFEAADGGCVFLDEVGELPLPAQAMLLRVIGQGEVLPLGATNAKRVRVRVIAATNRELRSMVEEGKFRADLYFRLRRLLLRVPPLRERGEDWRLIARHYLQQLADRHNSSKSLSTETVEWLRGYAWPGNVREVIGCVETGFYLSRSEQIHIGDIGEALENAARSEQLQELSFTQDGLTWSASGCCGKLLKGKANFWQDVYNPYMDRELNRTQVRQLIATGLEASQGSYKALVELFGMPASEYLKFMDFLRHHRLKPPKGSTQRPV